MKKLLRLYNVNDKCILPSIILHGISPRILSSILSAIFFSLLCLNLQAAELITFSNGKVADANDVNHNFRELATRIAATDSTPGPKGDKGDKGDSGVSTTGNNSQSALSQVARLLNKPSTDNHFPYSSLDSQTCPAKSSVRATAVINDKLNLNISQLLGYEGISKLFKFSFIGQSTEDFSPATLIGTSATLFINTAQGNRSVSGIVTTAAKSYAENGSLIYALSIEPTMAQLKLKNDYKIFQQMKRTDIIQEILQSAGISPDMNTSNAGDILDMSVMYNQNPFSYLQRLSEEAGLAYFFNGNNVIFTNNSNAYLNSGTTLLFAGHDVDISNLNTATQAYAFRYFIAQRSAATKFTAAGYDFQSADTAISNSQGIGQFEKYSFDFIHTNDNSVSEATGIAAAKETALSQQHFGSSNNPLIAAGYTFNVTVASGVKAALGGNYVGTEVHHALLQSPTGNCLLYANNFSSLPSTIIFKPEIKTPKAKALGVSTAVVVGPTGDTKYVDSYGRVKIQFHWDRQGSANENASAWVRVAVPVDRINDKLLYVPLIGTEVLVSFLNGDPSLPVIIGSMYNNNHLPALSLPANKFVNGGQVINDFPQ